MKREGDNDEAPGSTDAKMKKRRTPKTLKSEEVKEEVKVKKKPGPKPGSKRRPDAKSQARNLVEECDTARILRTKTAAP